MKTKAVIFDFDGTLSKPRRNSNTWSIIWEFLKDTDYDFKLYTSYKNGEFDYNTWCEKVINRFKYKGLKQSDIKPLCLNIELLSGVKETFEFFKQNGITIFILSSGIKSIIESILARYDVLNYLTEIVAEDLVFDNAGNLVGDYSYYGVIEPKSRIVKILQEKYGLLKEEIIYVGNDYNDEEVYKSGVTTLCINPDRADITNKTVWKYAIEKCNNLKEILPFIN